MSRTKIIFATVLVLTLSSATGKAQPSLVPISGLGGGHLNWLLFNSKNELIVATKENSVILSQDNGKIWKNINNGLASLPIERLAVDSRDWLYAVADSGKLFRSTNDGLS